MDQTINYKGFTITIVEDKDPSSPREWDNLGTMACSHNRYILGDEQFDDAITWLEGMLDYCNDEAFDTQKAYFQYLEEKFMEEFITLRLFLYDHSGITMSCKPFSCRWDSGQVGWIYISKEDARKEYGWKNITSKRRERIEGYLRGEVETYDAYLTGDVWGWRVSNEEDNHLDSCWGYYGYDDNEDHMIEQAKEAIDYYIKEQSESYSKKVKNWIRNRVPLHIRETHQNTHKPQFLNTSL